MVRMRFTIYKNSALASLISFLSNLVLLGGIWGLVGVVFNVIDGGLAGVGGIWGLLGNALGAIVIIAIGIGLKFLAEKIAERASERKAFKLWTKSLKEKGVLDSLPQSVELCRLIYRANPVRRTIRFIAKYNPLAAAEISESRKLAKAQMKEETRSFKETKVDNNAPTSSIFEKFGEYQEKKRGQSGDGSMY